MGSLHEADLVSPRGVSNPSTGLGNWANMPERLTVRHWRQREVLLHNINKDFIFIFIVPCFWQAGIKTQRLIPAAF